MEGQELITLKTAKLAKEKGFREIAIDWFEDERPMFLGEAYNILHCYKGLDIVDKTGEIEDYPDNLIMRPTQSFLQQWFRKKHNLDVYITPFYHPKGKVKWYRWDIVGENNEEVITDEDDSILEFYSTYKKALEIGLQHALKILKL